MPKLANRSGAMPKIQPPPPEPTEPTPEVVEKPSITESTADAFDQSGKEKNIVVKDEETIEEDVIPQTQTEPTEPIDIPKQKKQKKPCSDKLKAHLARCREISLAKRRSNKNTTPKTVATPTPPPQPKPQPQSHSSIDYDRIINGVSNSLYSRFGLDEPSHVPPQPQVRFHEQPRPPPRQSQEEMLKEYEKKIREDERNRKKAERQAELDRTFKSKGMNVLKNGMPTHHRNTNMHNNVTNPYAGAFGRRH